MMRQRAYASITVVLLIMIIITVGLSLVAITNSDYNLAEKKADWTERYYYSEAQLMEGIARLNIILRDDKEVPRTEELRALVARISEDLDGKIELIETEQKGRIELLFSENYEEGKMLIWAALEKAEDGNLSILSLQQEQENLEYDSFY